MIGPLRDIRVGGILVAPLVGDALVALAAFLALRLVTGWAVRRLPDPWSRRLRFDQVFANPPLAQAALYVCLLGLVVALR
jgi:hypothetical protein